MGVHGLTTYIESVKNQYGYMEKIWIEDRPVVIDGCNLMYFLYFDGKTPVVAKGGKKGNVQIQPDNAHLYGGDWIQYAQSVRHFFQQLKHCKITPIVIFDGAYDNIKIEVARQRFAKTVRENIKKASAGAGGYVEPGKTYTPLFLKNVFLEILGEQKIPHYQTIDEADLTIAYVAKILGQCPILSSDSDFFIYADSVPVPLKSLKFTQKAISQPIAGKKARNAGENKIWMLEGEYVSMKTICEREFHCSIELLPLAALIIGNDSIMNCVFTQFKDEPSNKRVNSVFKWLSSYNSVDAAFQALSATIPEERRDFVSSAMKYNIEIYKGENGEKRVWDLIKAEVNVSESIDKDMENRICSARLRNANFISKCLAQPDVVKHMMREMQPKDTTSPKKEEKDSGNSSTAEDDTVRANNLPPSIPDWYRQKHYRCEMQTYLLNVIKNRVIFLPPQVEIFDADSTHGLSIPIIKVTAGVLLGSTEETITLETQSKGKPIRQKILPQVSVDGCENFPILKELDDTKDKKIVSLDAKYSMSTRLKLILSTLRIIEEKDSTFLFYEGWPSSYRIWIATLMYFMKVKIYECPGTYDPLKTLAVISSIFLCIVKNLIVNPGNIAEQPRNKCLTAIRALYQATGSDPEKLKKVREFYQKFEDYSCSAFEVKRKSKKPTYDISIPYILSQYLCVVYHTEMLNSLLECPFKSPKIRYTVNNIFVYNLSRYILDKVEKNPGSVFNNVIAEAVGVEEVYEVLFELIGVCFNVHKLVKDSDSDQ